jgi:hypothetical protein
LSIIYNKYKYIREGGEIMIIYHIDEFGEEVKNKIIKENKGGVVTNILKEKFYDVINVITYQDLLSKGKISDMRVEVLYILAKELGIKDLDYYFDKEAINYAEHLNRLHNTEKNITMLTAKVNELTAKVNEVTRKVGS